MAPDIDDDALDLPPLPSLGDGPLADEELFGDAELPVWEPEGDEVVGLDAIEGLEDFDPVAFLDIRDEESAIGDPETSDLDIGDSEVGGGSEYGWTQDNEPATSLAELGPLVSELKDLGDDYGGAEGTDDPLFDASMFDADGSVASLPALEMDALGEESLIEDLDLGIAMDIDLGQHSFEEEARHMGSHLPPASPAVHRWLARDEASALRVDPEGRLYAAFGSAIRRAVPPSLGIEGAPMSWESLPGRGLETEEVVSLAFIDDIVFAGTRLGGLFRSSDGGASFEPINGWHGVAPPTVPCRVETDTHRRVWLFAGGALYRSSDLGTRWVGPVLPNPVVDVCADGDQLYAIGTSAEGWSITRTEDGVRWQSGPSGHGAPKASAANAGHVAIAFEDRPTWAGNMQGGHDVELLSSADALAVEADGVFGALHVQGGDRLLVIAARETEQVLLDLPSEEAADADGAHRVSGMVRWCGDLIVSTAAGILRVHEET